MHIKMKLNTNEKAAALRRRLAAPAVLLLAVLVAVSIGLIHNNTLSAQEAGRPGAVRMTALPEQGSVGSLDVMTGRSLIVRTPVPLKRVSVTDPAVASAIVVAPMQVMVHGLKPGTVSLMLWDADEQVATYDLNVTFDTNPLRAQLKGLFPGENIEISQLGGALVLSGEVSKQEVIDRAHELGAVQSPAVVNAMRLKYTPRDMIMLQVHFAEVNRTAIKELGINIFNGGYGNTIGSTTTQQFGEFVQIDTGGHFTMSDFLNIFMFRPDINVGATIRALQQKNLLQILAEPNLMAASGQEASFLAGGEFPFPTVQSGTGTTTVTITFKEFGIRLKFLADVLEDQTIRLRVAPEVSALDYSNALTVSGFLIPALTSRKAETEIELKNGQSFAIAGLLDNRVTEAASRIPGLSSIPILGNLFKSRATNQSQTELLVMVTPSIVQPLEPGQEQPALTFPANFIEDKPSVSTREE